MRISPRVWIWPLSVALGSACSHLSSAQPVDWVNCFDSADSSRSWVPGGTPQPVVSWDGTLDACGATNSGSVSIVEHFTGATSESFFVVSPFVDASNNPAIVDSSSYTGVSFDLRVAPTAALTTLGDFGPLDVETMATNGSMQWVGTFRIPATATNWIRVSLRFPPTASLEPLWALWFQMWPFGQCTNTLAFHVDNVGLEGCGCAPPPGLRMERALPGLHLIPPVNEPTDQRQSIYTLASSCSWVDAPAEVAYALSISQFPSSEWPHDPGFDAHMFLVPLGDMPAGPADSKIDWTATNVVYLQIANTFGGNALAQFMYKAHQGSGNSMFTNADPQAGPVGLLATLAASSPLGVWSVSFTANTNVTLRAPDGGATNFFLPAPAAALFRNSLHAYFGVSPNSLYNLGAEGVITRIQITGTPGALDETFSAPALDSEVWGCAAADPAGIFSIPPGNRAWLEWVGTERGYVLQASSNLVVGSWYNTDLATNMVSWGGRKRMLLPPPGPAEPPSLFFRIANLPVRRCGGRY